MTSNPRNATVPGGQSELHSQLFSAISGWWPTGERPIGVHDTWFELATACEGAAKRFIRPATITEERLVDWARAAASRLIRSAGSTPDLDAKPLLTSLRDTIRVVLAELGITVEPPIPPEPEGDVIVVDDNGNWWHFFDNAWTLRTHEDRARCTWKQLCAEYPGPLKVYRHEEVPK